MKFVVLFIILTIVLVGCSNKPSNLEINCCNACISHYNEEAGQLCSDQDYSDGNIKRHCFKNFEDDKYTLDYCDNLIE